MSELMQMACDFRKIKEELERFDQCYSLEAYEALVGEAEPSPSSDKTYLAETRKTNREVCDIIKGFGREGIEILAIDLTSGPVTIREKSAMVLSDIGRDYKERAIFALTERLNSEPERCVVNRIQYALRRLAE